MTITLNPEHEKLVNEAIRSGAYNNPGEVIGRALEVLSAEDQWLRSQRHTINEKIGRGLAQLDRGEGISGNEARVRLEDRKAAFLKQHADTAP